MFEGLDGGVDSAADELVGYLTSQLIRRGAHHSVQALEADIRTWMKNWNSDPKPFVRTMTAEEILESLAKYCRRISDAEHQCADAYVHRVG